MNAPQSPARTGVWIDYATSDSWLVVTAAVGYILLAFVGVWLSFSAKYINQILANFALYFHVGPRKQPRPGAPTLSTPLLEEQRSSAQVSERPEDHRSAKALARLYKDGAGVRDLVRELFCNEDLSKKHRGWLGLFLVVLSLFTVGFIFAGVYVARVKASGPAILDSQKCGLWKYNSSLGGPEAASRAGLRDLEKETRAGEYAQNCYWTADMFDAIQCNFLYRSRLSFSPATYTTDCPFQNEICGQNQTVTFTSEVDASELGINSRYSSKFRRRTSCTPLSMKYPFIQNETHNGTTTYYYYYGAKPTHEPPLEYTFNTTGDPFESFAPAYEMFTYTTHVRPKDNAYWTPRPELAHPEFSTLTLFFISSLRIFYEKRSEDPIFPADKEVYLPGGQKPWFRNSDPRARPLACINSIDLCLGDGTPCWPMGAPWPKDASNNTRKLPPDFWLMFISLAKTDVYNAIEKRLGRGLIAQSKVSQFLSAALEDYHWVDEVQHLVATTHAMTQINAWSIASGEDSVHEGKDGYSLKTSKDEYGDLCGMLKYNPSGYASIHFIPLLITLFSLPLMWVLSLEWPRKREISDTGGVEFRRPEAGSVGEAGPTQRSADPTATHSRTDDTERIGAASERRSSSATPQGFEQGPQPPRLVDPVAQQGSGTDRATIATPTDDSDDMEWEPLMIGKIIWVVFMIVYLVAWLLSFIIVGLPMKAFRWLGRRSMVRTWRQRLLDSLEGAYDWRLSRWWREFTNLDAVDE